MTPQQITVDGYDGSTSEDTSMALVRARVYADMGRLFPGGWQDRWEQGDNEVRAAARDSFQYHIFLPSIVRYHNQAVPAAAEYARLDRLAGRAVAAADSFYADLDKSTTVNWLAAHHRFVEACVRARELLTGRLAAAQALAYGEFGREMKDLCLAIYEKAVPAQQRIRVPDVDGERLALAEFVELTRTRLDILRATVSGGYPEGFAPPPGRVEPAPAGPVGDDWAADRTASVAVAAQARAW